jgi:hypothetical protein
MITDYLNNEELEILKKNLFTPDYCIDQCGIMTPKFIYSGDRWVDLCKIKSNLINIISKKEKSYVNFIKGLIKGNLEYFCQFESQFIFPLDQKLWLDCCVSTGIINELDQNRRYYKDRTSISVDLFFPIQNTAIEVDYKFTHNDKYDQTRDLYLSRKYGVKVIRIKEFNNDSDYRDIESCSITYEFLRSSFSNVKLKVDFTNLILQCFEIGYSNELSIIEDMKIFYNSDRNQIKLKDTHILYKNPDLLQRVKYVGSMIGLTIV